MMDLLNDPEVASNDLDPSPSLNYDDVMENATDSDYYDLIEYNCTFINGTSYYFNMTTGNWTLCPTEGLLGNS